MNFVWPSCCVLCQQPSTQLVCKFCTRDTDFFSHTGGPTNLLLRPAIARHLQHRQLCALHACGWYSWPFSTLLKRLKFQHDRRVVPTLADWFCQHHNAATLARPQVLLPVPLAAARYGYRQFNQAGALARALSARTGIPTHAAWARRRGGPAQSSLGKRERAANLRQAFSLRALPPVSQLAIVDDIVTTGSTADQLARQIRRQLPTVSIQLWAIAVTPAPAQQAQLNVSAPTGKLRC